MIDEKLLYKFWSYLTSDYRILIEYCEIRVLPTDKRLYNIMYIWAKENNVYIKNKSQLFFRKRDFNLLYKFLSHKNYVVVKNAKVCYTLNPRVMVNGEIIKSGYDNMRSVYMVFLDIEMVNHKVMNIFEKKLLKAQIIKKIINPLKNSKLKHHILIDSGNGYHLLYKIKRSDISKSRKAWFKKFINYMIESFNDTNYRIDPLKDFTRIFALPYTINQKHNRVVQVINPKYQRNEITMPFVRLKKKLKYNMFMPIGSTVEKSLVWNLLQQDIPQGEIHLTLIFALKLLLKSLNLNYSIYEDKLNIIRDSSHSLNYNTGCDGKHYNKGIVINWCKRNIEWCDKNFKDWKDNKYI
ncbi:MAG: hypothetical protein KAX49_14440 [Halanaerobiales bacterium]|nr:hypothetical protein [Halanaerobiales bacterium]